MKKVMQLFTQQYQNKKSESLRHNFFIIYNREDFFLNFVTN